MNATEDSFRALARSSPWRWRTLHCTFITPYEQVEAWVRRPGQLLVRRQDGELHRVDDRSPLQGSMAGMPAVYTDDLVTFSQPPPRRWPHQVAPLLRADGLVAERPSVLDVEYGDPMYQSYDWVAMLDPVELSLHTTVSDVREVDRLGRRTWRAKVRAQEGYEPTCGCCPLLWSYISDRDEYADDDGVTWRPKRGTVYPESYDVALDVQTGVVVELTAVGAASLPTDHRLELLEVDADVSDVLPD